MVSMISFTFGMINIFTQERLHTGYVSYLAFLSSLQLRYLGADRNLFPSSCGGRSWNWQKEETGWRSQVTLSVVIYQIFERRSEGYAAVALFLLSFLGEWGGNWQEKQLESLCAEI